MGTKLKKSDGIKERPIKVFCGTCQEYIDERAVEFLNIEEDLSGRDIMTFICPSCKERKRSLRLG